MICDFLVEKYVYVIFWWKNMCKTSKISKFWREHNFFWRPPRFVTTLAMPKQTRTKVGWIPSGFLFRSSEFTWQLFECVSIYIYNLYNYTSNSNPLIVGFTLRFFFRHHCVSCRGSHIIWNNWVGVLQRCVHLLGRLDDYASSRAWSGAVSSGSSLCTWIVTF